MPTVPVPKYNGPQVAPAALPAVRVSGGNPSFGQEIGQALFRAGLQGMDIQYRREAVADSTAAINSAKRRLDEWEAKALMEPDAGLPGQPPRFETVMRDYDTFAAQLRDDALKSTGNDLAKQTIAQTLSNYFERARMSQLDRAQKQKRAAYFATTLQDIDTAVSAPGIPDDERRLRIDQALGGAIAAGAIEADDAYKLKRKAEQDLEYGAQFARIQSANTLTEAAELRGSLGQFNPKLSPDQNRDLLAQANARVTELEKRADKAVEAQRDDVQKMFQDAQVRGLLTVDMVQRWRSLLSADDYARALHDATTAGGKIAEGTDNPDASRRFLSEINRNYQNGPALKRLRDQVNDAARGYDPATKSFGEPSLSRSTARQFLNDIDEYTARLQARTREDRSSEADAKEQARKQRTEVESLLRQAYKRFTDSRGSDSEKRQAEAGLQADLESLLKDGYRDPIGWFDKWKASHEPVLKARPALPSYVPQKNGKPDFDAARKKLADDFKAKAPGVQTQQQYDGRFRAIQQLEREYAQ